MFKNAPLGGTVFSGGTSGSGVTSWLRRTQSHGTRKMSVHDFLGIQRFAFLKATFPTRGTEKNTRTEKQIAGVFFFQFSYFFFSPLPTQARTRADKKNKKTEKKIGKMFFFSVFLYLFKLYSDLGLRDLGLWDCRAPEPRAPGPRAP